MSSVPHPTAKKKQKHQRTKCIESKGARIANKTKKLHRQREETEFYHRNGTSVNEAANLLGLLT